MVNTRVGTSSVFASLPFDQIEGPATISIHEDFIDTAVTADLVDGTGVVITNLGPHGWFGAEIAGAAVSNITLVTAVADHPGIIRLEVGSTSAADGDACSLQYGRNIVSDQDMYLPDDNGMYIATVIRIADVSDTIVEFGFVGQTPEVPGVGALDIAGIVFDPEDALNVDDKLFFAQLNDNNTDVSNVMSELKYVENDWVLLEVALDSAGASYRVTTEDGSETTNITGTITVTMRPAWTVENVGSAEEVLDIDLFHLRYLRRDALVGTAADWLGA